MNLIELFKKLKSTVHLNAEREAEIRGRVLQFMKAESAVRSGDAARLIKQRSNITEFLLKPVPMPIIAIIAIAAVLGGGTSFAAENSLPGDALYPIKVNLNENVVAALQFSSENRAAWETALAGRRLEEAAQLAAEGRMNAEIRAQIENSFDTHAGNARKKIADIESSGNITAAAGVTSDFESILNAHSAVFARLVARSTSSADIENENSIKAKIKAELDSVSKKRAELEVKISSLTEDGDESKADVKTAAEGKLNAALNVIHSVKSFLDLKESQVGTSSTIEARARLTAAENLVADGNAKVEAGNYAEAFNEGNQAIRMAQEAKLLITANANLNLDIRIDARGEEENEIHGNSSGSSSGRNEGSRENGIRSSSSVNMNTDDDDNGGASGEIKVEVGL
ncbi:MAG: hypothetical protein HY432_03045 [Candidatus Liptonbacteria bacterium]|nr:hypothetical protein [Candidatus Liptonbacteria bacterium]